MRDAIELLQAQLLGESDWIGVEDLCRLCRLELTEVIELAELGVFEPRGDAPERWLLPATMLPRLRTASRLIRDLGVNVSGAALVLDEFALILHLQDVYWAEDGRTSVDAVFAAVAVAGLLILGFNPLSFFDVGAWKNDDSPAVRISVVVMALLTLALAVVVLLKGYRTVIAHPDGGAWVNPTGTPALATAGTGDVLAGLLVSLLAGGLPAERAALAAAYVHGLAARHAASAISPDDLAGPVTEDGNRPSEGIGGVTRPVTAQDVANALPMVIASLGRPY